MIPELKPDTGNLPTGIYEASWAKLTDRFGTTAGRRGMLQGVHAAAELLASFGSTRLWVDGSFVTAKESPADHDACWDMAGVEWRALQRAEPRMCDLNTDRASQKASFGGP